MRGGLVAGAGAAAVCAAVLLFVPRIPQPVEYHAFADMRSWLGIPNALNVLSNLPFAVVGVWGLALVLRAPRGLRWDRAPYAVLFGGVLLTAFGSGYYHLAPDNARLVWDRLPMAIGFMGLLIAVVGERTDARAGRSLLAPLVGIGVASVAWWHWTETHGAGDLRPYLLVQAGSLLAIAALLAWSRGACGGGGYVWAALGFYAAAKALELADRAVLEATALASGHTLKHLLAAAGVACLAAMVRRRGAEVRGEPGLRAPAYEPRPTSPGLR